MSPYKSLKTQEKSPAPAPRLVPPAIPATGDSVSTLRPGGRKGRLMTTFSAPPSESFPQNQSVIEKKRPEMTIL